MTPWRILQLILAVSLAVVFWMSVQTVGRMALSVGRWRSSDRTSSELAVGLGAYVICAAGLGSIGWLRWPVVAAIAVVPGVVGALHRLATWRVGRLTDAWDGSSTSDRVAWAGFAAVGAVYVLLASAPAVHYDLMVNYLAVPKAYLVSGSTAPLATNVFSTLSFGLHLLIVYPLAMSGLVDRSPFLFGGAEVVGYANLVAMVIAGGAAIRLGRRISDRWSGGGRAALIAVLVWGCMPQNLLVAALELPDPFVTCLAMLMASSLVAAASDRGAGDAIACGVACGLLVACKPQAAVPVAVAGIWWLARLRRDRFGVAFFVAAIAGWAPSVIRTWASFGSPLYPFVGSDGRAGAVHALLRENAVDLPGGLVELGVRVVDLVTLFPEVGFVPLALIGLLLARPRSPILLAFGLVPVLALCVASGSTHNVLRWIQAPMLLLLVLAGEGTASLAMRLPIVRAFPLVVAFASFGVGLLWVDGTVGLRRGLRDSEQIVRDTISAFDLRERMAGDGAGRVLWIGEVQGYWGGRNGTFLTVRDGAFIGRVLDSGDPVRELRERGFTTVVRTHGREDMLEQQGFWRDVGPTPATARRRVEDLLSRLAVRETSREAEVYDLPPPSQ